MCFTTEDTRDHHEPRPAARYSRPILPPSNVCLLAAAAGVGEWTPRAAVADSRAGAC